MPVSGTATDWAVDLRHVSKTYGRRIRALDDVDIQVGRGQIFGLLGPNGAGKSTLVKIITTVVRPTRAEGRVLGERLGSRRALQRVGYLPESHRFPDYLTANQLLDYYAALAKVPRSDRRARAPQLLERVGLTDWARTRISKFSKGMLQRLGLAQALMNEPDLVFLDEPTDGLDPMGRRDVREILVELREQGKTVFVNSHLLSEVESVSDRVAILASGKVVREGTIRELTQNEVEHRVVVQGELTALADALRALGVTIEGNAIRVRSEDVAKLNAVIDLVRARGMLIAAVEPRRISLEDIFIQAVGGAKTAPPTVPPVPAPGGPA